MKSGTELTEAEQKSAGAALGGDMSQRHKDFVQQLSLMIEKKEIDPDHFESFLNKKIYDDLDEALKTKVDIALPNISILLRHVIGFYQSKQTPDACPQLASMIDQLWEMKERIEVFADVFTF